MSKIIVTHTSPDLDAVTSVWLLKRFLPEWANAKVAYVPAGQQLENNSEEHEILHVDTGMGELDHHQFQDETICAASIVRDYVLKQPDTTLTEQSKITALDHIIDLVIDEDHFQQVFYPDSDSYIREFTLVGILDGMKLQPGIDDDHIIARGMEALDALLLSFESRVTAEEELKNGKTFSTKWGDAIACETVNDTVMKLAQIKGYSVVVRLDPSSHLLRIKAWPRMRSDKKHTSSIPKERDIDLTPVYTIVKEKDPYASWFLHASKRMLLNGSSKNPNSISTKLEIDEIIEILKSIQ
ncbi:MAG TPA: DHH family phosphoesterase [Candidatus Levybacteria bacterium]|nr:DHH family phosphoesterase [Candidatus Levybacteria bacterium]